MGIGDLSIKWMDDTIEEVPSNRFLYKVLCLFSGRRKRKITYKELYVIYSFLYDIKGNDILEVKKKAMEKIIDIYRFNNGKI